MRDVDGVVDVDDVQNTGDSAGVHDVGGEDGARTCMMLANQQDRDDVGRVGMSSVSHGWEMSMVPWMWMMFRMPVIPRASMMLAMRMVPVVASRRRKSYTTRMKSRIR